MADVWESTRESHRSKQSTAISASALELLTEHGAPALTMAFIAEHAGISRQTLYRYFPDVEAVLVGIAEFVTSHDDDFAELVQAQPDPRSRLEWIAVAATSPGHQDVAGLVASLPPTGREILARHHARSVELLARVLTEGIDDGSFTKDLEPSTDAALFLGLLAAADADHAQRAVEMVQQIAESPTKEKTG